MVKELGILHILHLRTPLEHKYEVFEFDIFAGTSKMMI